MLAVILVLVVGTAWSATTPITRSLPSQARSNNSVTPNRSRVAPRDNNSSFFLPRQHHAGFFLFCAVTERHRLRVGSKGKGPRDAYVRKMFSLGTTPVHDGVHILSTTVTSK